MGYNPWGCKEWDTTEQLHIHMYPLEKEIATHSSILVWRIPWIEESARLQFMGSQESDTTQQLNHNQGIKRYKLLCINTIK